MIPLIYVLALLLCDGDGSRNQGKVVPRSDDPTCASARTSSLHSSSPSVATVCGRYVRQSSRDVNVYTAYGDAV
jgi:hypothetical protein